MPEENGIIHGDGELENGGEGLGDIRNFAEEKVCTHVDQNHDADADKENEGNCPVVKTDEHDGKGEHDGDDDIDKFFGFGEVAHVGDECRHTRNVGFAVDNVADFVDRVDSFVSRGGGVEKDGHNGFFAVSESIIKVIGNDLGRQASVFERTETHDGVDVVNVFDGSFEVADLRIGKPIGDNH